LIGQSTVGSPFIQSLPAGQGVQSVASSAFVPTYSVPSGHGNWSGYQVLSGQKWFTAQFNGFPGSSDGQAFPAGQGVQSQFTPVPVKE